MRLGIALFALGSIFLLHNLGLLSDAHISLVWPTLLLIAGLVLIIKPTYRCGRCAKSMWMSKHRCDNCSKQWCGKAECEGCDVCDGRSSSGSDTTKNAIA